MTLNLLTLISVVCLSSITANAAELPEKFIGEWVIKIRTQTKKFPWWHQIKYPVKLEIRSKTSGKFTDQMGGQCNINVFYYDSELDKIVLKYCGGATKAAAAIDPMHLISVKNNKIYGEVRTYKHLFNWEGEKVRKFKK